MATLIWTGATDGVFGTATNWLVESTGAVSEAAPATDDNIIIPNDANVSQDIVGDDHNDVFIDKFIIEDGCSLNIGTPQEPLRLGAKDAADWTWGGDGEYHIQVAANTAGVDEIAIQGAGAYHLASYSGERLADDLNITNAAATVYVAWRDSETAVIDTKIVSAGTLYLGTSVATGDPAAITLVLTGGTCVSKCGLAAVTNTGATHTHYAGTITAATMYDGTLYLVGGELDTAHIYSGGAVDLTKATSALTVSTVNVHGSGAFNDPDSRASAGTIINVYGASSAATIDTGETQGFTTGTI